MNLPQDIQKVITSGLTFQQMKAYLDGKPNLHTQQEIAQMSSLAEVFGGNDHAVIFTATNSPTDGHYQAIFLNKDNQLFFFDSYGMKPPDMILKVEKELGKNWGQNAYALPKLIKQSPYANNAFYNDVRYQSTEDNVATCGRYVIVVILLNSIFKKNGMSFNLSSFNTIMKGWKKKYNKSYDDIVAFFVDSP